MSKRILSLWMVLLLFAGLAGNAQAAVADPQGVSIRVNSPADDTWAGIGDDIVVYVNAFTNVSPDSIQVALSSSADAEKYGDLAIIEVEVDSVKTGDDAKGLSKTWIVTYDVGTGTIETTEKDVVVQVRMVFGTAAKILTNQSEDTITGTSSTEVGDQVKFGIDEVRPSTVGTGIVVTVAIDTAGTASYLGSATQRAFKIDDEVKISPAKADRQSGQAGRCGRWRASGRFRHIHVYPGGRRFRGRQYRNAGHYLPDGPGRQPEHHVLRRRC